MTKIKKAFFYIAKLGVLGVLFWFLFCLFLYVGFSFGLIVLVFFPLEIAFFIRCTMRLDVLGKDEKAKGRKLGFRFLFSLPLMIPSVFLGLALVFHEDILYDISDYKKQRRSGIYYSQADEIIGINGSVNKIGDGILNTPLEDSAIMIDYDTKRVSFILRRAGGMLFSYELSEEVSRPPEMRLQFEASLSSPGKSLRTYYKSVQTENYTAFVELELENGEIWRSAISTESLGIENNYPLILEAVEASDLTIEYLDKPLPENAANMEHPSIMFDFDDMYAYIAHGDVSFTCQDLKLTRYKSLPDMEIIAKIEMESPWKEVYIFTRLDRSTYKELSGVVLLSEENTMYFGEYYYPLISTFGFEDSEYAFTGDQHDIEKSLGVFNNTKPPD